jgi:hypothetical protein
MLRLGVFLFIWQPLQMCLRSFSVVQRPLFSCPPVLRQPSCEQRSSGPQQPQATSRARTHKGRTEANDRERKGGGSGQRWGAEDGARRALVGCPFLWPAGLLAASALLTEDAIRNDMGQTNTLSRWMHRSRLMRKSVCVAAR